MPVELPADGDLASRVSRIAAITRQRKAAADHGASAILLGPPFRLLAATRLAQPLLSRQRLIHTLATNLPGPQEKLALAGAPITEIIPVTGTTGNVTIGFAALSYAGVLCLAVVCDPSRAPDVQILTSALGRELAATAS